MEQGNKENDFVSIFKKLSKNEQIEVMQKLIPEICHIAMEDKFFIQEMMPKMMGRV